MSTTIGDLIQGQKQAEQAEAASKAAADAANQAYAAAQAASAAASTQLKVGLGQTGPVYVQDTTGAIAVYLPDASAAGYSVIQPAASTVVVDTTPAPAPVSVVPDATSSTSFPNSASTPASV